MSTNGALWTTNHAEWSNNTPNIVYILLNVKLNTIKMTHEEHLKQELKTKETLL